MTHEECKAAILAREQEKGVVTEAELRQQLADAIHQRDMLGKAIGDAALKTGIIREGVGLTGPQLMMLADDMAECSKASEARNAELEGLLTMLVENSDDRDVVELSLNALAQSAPAAANQCDGCQAGKPLENGNRHRMGREGGYPDFMSCTAKLYAPATDEQGAKADHGLLQGIVDLKDMKP